MRILRKLQAVLAVTAVLALSPAQAVLISEDDAVFGANRVTFDTDTGLQWLDLSVTTPMSVNAVLASIAGGALQGWQYASAAQVTGLWNNAGVPLPIPAPGFPMFDFGSAQNNAALALNALLDAQWNNAELTRSLGYILELSTISPFWWEIGASIADGGIGYTSASFLIGTFDTVSPIIGSYLVRSAHAVSEPDTLSLALFAAVLMLGRAVATRKRRGPFR